MILTIPPSKLAIFKLPSNQEWLDLNFVILICWRQESSQIPNQSSTEASLFGSTSRRAQRLALILITRTIRPSWSMRMNAPFWSITPSSSPNNHSPPLRSHSRTSTTSFSMSQPPRKNATYCPLWTWAGDTNSSRISSILKGTVLIQARARNMSATDSFYLPWRKW